MNIVIILLVVVVLLMQIIIIYALWNGFEAQKIYAGVTQELWTQLGKSLEASDYARREGHLQIMKSLKGDSYVGQFGGMDIHTDPNVPPDGILFPDMKDVRW
jgi:hypothetical protein